MCQPSPYCRLSPAAREGTELQADKSRFCFISALKLQLDSLLTVKGTVLSLGEPFEGYHAVRELPMSLDRPPRGAHCIRLEIKKP